jgi:ribonuclease HI
MIIYTDGACSKNGKFGAKGGIGIFFQESGKSISMPFKDVYTEFFDDTVPPPTNQKAELLAILKALNEIQHQTKETTTIITDSMYCINSCTKWYKSWQKNNWKTATNKPVANQNIIKKILEYVNEKVNFKYTPAHTIQPDESDPRYKDWYGNFMADKLAVNSL